MRLLLVSRTIGPAKNLARVAQAALDRNHEVAAVLSKDAAAMVPVSSLFDFAPQMVLASTSGSNIEDELKVIRVARDSRIPFGIFCDTYGTFMRPQFTPDFREACAVLFVPDKVEWDYAKEAGFKNAIVSGVPLWEDFSGIKENTPLRRAHFVYPENFPSIFVLHPLDKNGELNIQTLREVWRALELVKTQTSTRFFYMPRFHPGDPNLKANPDYYKEVLGECPVTMIFTEYEKKTEYLVPACDIVLSSFSNLGIAGIYNRKPVVEYLPPYLEDRLESLIGRRVWPPAVCGAALLARDAIHLAQNLFACSSGNPCLLAQERHYPIQKSGVAERIVTALEALM